MEPAVVAAAQQRARQSSGRRDGGFQVMANTREPILQTILIASLHPTQMTVGMREVKEKRKRWREHKSAKKQAELLGKHMIPVVLGPGKRHYVVDHHHLARALHDEGVKEVLVSVIADLTMVDRDAFWGVLDNRRWVYPYDVKGERRHFRDIPRTVAQLKDGSVPQPRRRIAPRRRFCQGHHAVQRVPVGGFFAAQDFAQDRGRQFRQGDREGAATGQGRRRRLFAGLVRAGVGRLA
jgi:hypothetical protein